MGQKDVSTHLTPVLTIPSSLAAQPSSLPSPELLQTICIFFNTTHSEYYWEHEYTVNLMLDDMKAVFQYFGAVVVLCMIVSGTMLIFLRGY